MEILLPDLPGIDLPQPSSEITRLNPQQRKNFIVEGHTFDAAGIITPAIDNSQNGTTHVISFSDNKVPKSLILPLHIEDVEMGKRQTYLIREHIFGVYMDFPLRGGIDVKACGEFTTSQGQDLMIEVTNINGVLYVEGKNYG